MLLSNRPWIRKAQLGAAVLSILVLFTLFRPHSGPPPEAFPGPAIVPPLKLPATSIPEKIWYKMGPKGLSDEPRNWIHSCLEKNPTFQHEILTDDSGDAYVTKKYASRPDIVQTYLSLRVPILKADFLRYLLLYAEGGVYNDLDVSCEDTPIQDWIPAQYKDKADLAVGWEFDMGEVGESLSLGQF